MRWVMAASLRAVVLGALWAALTAASVDYAVYGLLSVAACTALSLWLMPPQGPARVGRWPRRTWFFSVLCLWFLWQSVLGGVDVAVRSLRRPVRIAPTVVTAPIDLPEGHARQVAMVLMNLMPGSMIQRTTDQDGVTALVTTDADTAEPLMVELHTLAAELDPARQWKQLQHRVARAFD
jgi:multicomponent Na+:H+ antiporter subunit E